MSTINVSREFRMRQQKDVLNKLIFYKKKGGRGQMKAHILPRAHQCFLCGFAVHKFCSAEIGRAHVRTPVTFRTLVCRLLLEKKK